MNNENKWKKKGKKVLPALEEKNLAKIQEEKDKKLARSLGPIEQKENVFEKSLNSEEHMRKQRF